MPRAANPLVAYKRWVHMSRLCHMPLRGHMAYLQLALTVSPPFLEPVPGSMDTQLLLACSSALWDFFPLAGLFLEMGHVLPDSIAQ